MAGGYLTKQTSLVAQLAQAEFEDRYRFFSQHTSVDAAFTHSAAFRREIFLHIAGFDERMPNNGDDLELSYRLILSGYQILFTPKGRGVPPPSGNPGGICTKKVRDADSGVRSLPNATPTN